MLQRPAQAQGLRRRPNIRRVITKRRPRLLDLFCGAGGASLGYYGAGFDVTGVDIIPQPRYPFPFLEMDVRDEELWKLVEGFDAVHASPPCQDYSKFMRHLSLPTPRMIGLIRRLCNEAEKPFIIENVAGAPLLCPVELCGRTFGLRVKRHRLFECNFDVMQPRCICPLSDKPINSYDEVGRARIKKEFRGQAPDRVFAEAMGVRWMNKEESREAIPPVYTRHIGLYLRKTLKEGI